DSVTVKMTNVNCVSHNKSWVRINQCRLKAIDRHTVVLNFNATFLHSTKSIRAHYQMFKRANGYKPWLINMSLDCCQFLKKPFDAFGIIVYNLYKDFSNINHTCPLSGDVLIQGMYLRDQVLRLPFPSGDFMFASIWSFYERPQFTVNISFLFTEDLMKS
ncbi:hypothetical protein KR018_003984, partial [Drosophila ironensis]